MLNMEKLDLYTLLHKSKDLQKIQNYILWYNWNILEDFNSLSVSAFFLIYVQSA